MIRRKPYDDDEENPDRWLVSYADFITLLFAFFVVMYAISSLNVSKYKALTTSMGTAFTGASPTIVVHEHHAINKKDDKSVLKPLPLDYLFQEKMKHERESMSKMGMSISNALAPLVENGNLHVMQNSRGVKIDINENVLFGSGSADLSASALPVLGEIATILNTNQRLVQIEGHTDNTPIHNATFYSNWELSAVRASSVVRTLIDNGVTDTRLSAVGYGSTQPISSSDTAFGQASNRRVSILILYDINKELADNVEIKPAVN